MLPNSNNTLPPTYSQSNTAATRDSDNRARYDVSPLVSPPLSLSRPSLDHLPSSLFLHLHIPTTSCKTVSRAHTLIAWPTWVSTPLLRSMALTRVSWHHPLFSGFGCACGRQSHIPRHRKVSRSFAGRWQCQSNGVKAGRTAYNWLRVGCWVQSPELSGITPPP